MILQGFRNEMSGFSADSHGSKQQIPDIIGQLGLGGASGSPVPPQSGTNFRDTLDCACASVASMECLVNPVK